MVANPKDLIWLAICLVFGIGGTVFIFTAPIILRWIWEACVGTLVLSIMGGVWICDRITDLGRSILKGET